MEYNLRLRKWNLYRRFSLLLMGYQRPPFTLIFINRHRTLGILHTESYNGEKLRKGFFARPLDDKGDKKAYYLWPDRLRWNFWFYAILVPFPILCFPLLLVDNSLPYNIALYFFIIALQAIIFPALCFFTFRIPLLDSITQKVPSSIAKQMEACVTASQTIEVNKYSCFAKLFPPLVERMDAVYYSPHGSLKESLLRLALIEKYKEPANEETNAWVGQPFKRWLFYWCSPVWTSYFILWCLLFLVKQLCSDASSLYISVILWAIFSGLYVKREAIELCRWVTMTERDKMFLPILIQGRVPLPPVIGYMVPETNINKLTGIIFGTALAVYSAALRILI